jgi:hypothetical protein
LPRRCGPQHGHSFGLASLATLRFVFELLVVKEQLFARGEDEIRAAVDTLQYLVLKFHLRDAPFTPCPETTQTNYHPRVDPESLPPQANALDISPGLGPPCRNGDMVYFFTIFTIWCEQGNGPPLGVAAHEPQSCSLRAFFRLRLRASASFTRFFSPGFR